MVDLGRTQTPTTSEKCSGLQCLHIKKNIFIGLNIFAKIFANIFKPIKLFSTKFKKIE